jgi:hypothetical protein
MNILKLNNNEIAILVEALQEYTLDLDMQSEKSDVRALKAKIRKTYVSKLKNKKLNIQDYMTVELFDMMKEAIIYSFDQDCSIHNALIFIINEHICKAIDNAEEFQQFSSKQDTLLTLFYDAASFSSSEILEQKATNEREVKLLQKLKDELASRS